MRKCLIDGQEVEVIKEIDGGFLYKHVFYDSEYSEEYVSDDITYFTNKLYDTPPTEKYNSKITDLQRQIDELQGERNKIRGLMLSEKSLLTEIKKRDFVQGLVNYLNGNFKYVLLLDKMEIKDKSSVYVSDYIKITNTKGSGFSLFTLRNDNYDHYDDRPIMVFDTFEAAQIYAKTKLLNELEYATEKATYIWASNTIGEWYEKIHSSSKLKEDEEIKAMYLKKFNEAKIKEDAKNKEKIQKEIEEKQKTLNDILNRSKQIIIRP
jgi:hypothetical protein